MFMYISEFTAMYGFFILNSVYDCPLGFSSIMEPELFLIDSRLVVVVYMVAWKLETVLPNFYLGLFRK